MMQMTAADRIAGLLAGGIRPVLQADASTLNNPPNGRWLSPVSPTAQGILVLNDSTATCVVEVWEAGAGNGQGNVRVRVGPYEWVAVPTCAQNVGIDAQASVPGRGQITIYETEYHPTWDSGVLTHQAEDYYWIDELLLPGESLQVTSPWGGSVALTAGGNGLRLQIGRGFAGTLNDHTHDGLYTVGWSGLVRIGQLFQSGTIQSDPNGVLNQAENFGLLIGAESSANATVTGTFWLEVGDYATIGNYLAPQLGGVVVLGRNAYLDSYVMPWARIHGGDNVSINGGGSSSTLLTIHDVTAYLEDGSALYTNSAPATIDYSTIRLGRNAGVGSSSSLPMWIHQCAIELDDSAGLNPTDKLPTSATAAVLYNVHVRGHNDANIALSNQDWPGSSNVYTFASNIYVEVGAEASLDAYLNQPGASQTNPSGLAFVDIRVGRASQLVIPGIGNHGPNDASPQGIVIRIGDAVLNPIISPSSATRVEIGDGVDIQASWYLDVGSTVRVASGANYGQVNYGSATAYQHVSAVLTRWETLLSTNPTTTGPFQAVAAPANRRTIIISNGANQAASVQPVGIPAPASSVAPQPPLTAAVNVGSAQTVPAGGTLAITDFDVPAWRGAWSQIGVSVSYTTAPTSGTLTVMAVEE